MASLGKVELPTLFYQTYPRGVITSSKMVQQEEEGAPEGLRGKSFSVMYLSS